MTYPLSIIGLDRSDLKQHLSTVPAYRIEQIWHWIYKQGVHDFEQMMNIPNALRQELQEKFTLQRPRVTSAQASLDGTQKWLLAFQDGQEAEAVHIPEKTRGTLCISSQIGCTLTCKFCHTGTQRLVRNLTSGEIVGQIMVARDVFGEWPTREHDRHISHVVMMGMGEPLFNYDNVKKALQILMDPKGIHLSPRRITLSTSGVVPLLQQCHEELDVNIAISLHAVRDELRNEIVPLNRKYPLNDLLAVCRDIAQKRRITFEYVMLKGVNDSDIDAKELLQLIRGMDCKINLIPFNPWNGSPYACSTPSRMQKFAHILQQAGYASPLRKTRGQDILAACGQLKSNSVARPKHLKT